MYVLIISSCINLPQHVTGNIVIVPDHGDAKGTITFCSRNWKVKDILNLVFLKLKKKVIKIYFCTCLTGKYLEKSQEMLLEISSSLSKEVDKVYIMGHNSEIETGSRMNYNQFIDHAMPLSNGPHGTKKCRCHLKMDLTLVTLTRKNEGGSFSFNIVK